MTINYAWTISQLDCVPHADGLTDIVQTVHWRCTGNLDQFTGTVYSTCTLPAPAPDSGDFVPYPDLTQAAVLEWIWANGVDKNATEASVASQIETQQNPPIVRPPLPWTNNAAPDAGV